MRVTLRTLRGAVAGVCLLAGSAGAQTLPMEVRTADETAVPGGVVQMKLEVTEPRPIFTGGGGWSFNDYDQFLGLAVGGSPDSAAVGVMRGANLKVRMVAPSNDLAQIDYPILVTALRVPSSLNVGHTTVVSLGIDSFTGPGGAAIPTVPQPGIVTVAQGAWIGNVTPGSATVPAGGVITITGGGFTSGTVNTVTLKGTPSTFTVIDDNTIRVVPSRAVTMHGTEVLMDVRSGNGNGGNRQSLSYYSYQRTTPIQFTKDALFSAVEPAFQRLSWHGAKVSFPVPTAGKAFGLSLQNTSGADSSLTVRLVNGGAPAGSVVFSLPENYRISIGVTDLFPQGCTAACSVHVAASSPVQVLGLLGDRPADAVDPVLPQLDTVVPTVLDFTTAVNASTFRTGDPFVTTATFSPGDTATAVDAYTVLQFPTGQYYSLTPNGLVPGILPLLRTTVTGASTIPLLSLPLPAGAPLGQYTWLSALAAPGTLNLLTPIRVSTFTVVP
ncbi:MAG: IPT/TIG domain-containing protein [Vicinamibacterales bacterium]